MNNYIPGPVRDILRIEEEIKTVIANKTDQERSQIPYMHEMWSPNCHYFVSDVRRRGEVLYKCLIEHDSQMSWKPENTPSLWTKIMFKYGIRIIEDNIPAENPYNEGDLGWWNDILYRSILPGANVYNPEQYPVGWELVEQSGDSTEEEPDIEQCEVLPEEPNDPVEDEPINEDELSDEENDPAEEQKPSDDDESVDEGEPDEGDNESTEHTNEEPIPDTPEQPNEDEQEVPVYKTIYRNATVDQMFGVDEIGIWEDGLLYRSLINGNVYTPESYPAGWEVVENADT